MKIETIELPEDVIFEIQGNEVTGFLYDMKHKSFKYENYLKTIDLKRKSVENYGCNFEFVQKKLNRSEIKYIKGYVK